MQYKGEELKVDLSPISIARLFVLVTTTIIAYSIALFPVILIAYFSLQHLDLSHIVHLFILSIIAFLCYSVFVLSTILSTAFFINIFRLKYEEGEYGKSIRDKNAYKWAFFFFLYTPAYKLINVFIIPPLKSFYLSLIGCKIGKNVYLAGEEWISDPCVTEIGENTMVGGRALITGHLAEDKLIVKKVTIGKNCLIGGESFIMPGATISDNVVVGAKSLVLKNQKLEKGKTYIGVPAKEKFKK